MKNTVKSKNSTRSFLCLLTMVGVLLAIMIFVAESQATTRHTPGEAEKDQPSYAIEGEVKKAGRFHLVKDFHVKNAILASGGLTRNADRSRAEIIRYNKRQKAYYTIYFKADGALSGDPTDNIPLLDRDRIIIPSVRVRFDQELAEDRQTGQESVFIAGEIAKPGAYPYKGVMNVWDLVVTGGGTLKTSYPEQAELLSVVSKSDQPSGGTNRKLINLRKARQGDPEHNVPLRPGDRLIVKNIPDGEKPLPTVCVFGEVLLPGMYPVSKGERLSSVIERAGGYRPDARPRAAVLTRERVRNLQQGSLEEMVARIEKDLSAQNFEQDGKPDGAKETAEQKTETAAKIKLFRQIKALKVTGRMNVVGGDVETQTGKLFDLELEDKDSLYISPGSDAVRVAGAVVSEGSYKHTGQSDYRDYIEAAGGYKQTADDTAVFVVKGDGSTRKLAGSFAEWSKKRKRLEIGGGSRVNYIIEPGDVIVVPEQVNFPAWLKEIYGITQILLNNGVVDPKEMEKKKIPF